MMQFKRYIGQTLIGKKLQFLCECIVPLNYIGTVVDFEITGNEIVFLVDVNGKIIKIGENHPNLTVKEI